jgi:hypothetical protein
LRQRIETEMARLSAFDISSYLIAEAPPAEEPDDGRPKASEVDIDAALGAMLWRARAQFEGGHCFHVTGPASTLVGVACPRSGVVGARPRVAQDDLAALVLHRRPGAAGHAPPGYRQTSAAAVMWRFALFGADGPQTLPKHYRQFALRLVAPPPLDRSLVSGRHVKLMQLFAQRDHSFAELREITGLSETQLCRDLGALVVTGCLAPA